MGPAFFLARPFRLAFLVQHSSMLQVFRADRLHQDTPRGVAEQFDQPQVELFAAHRRDAAPEGAHLEALQSEIETRFAEPLADTVIRHVVDYKAEGFIYHLKRKDW